MGNSVIKFGSVTYATKAKKMLLREGLKTDLIKVDSSKGGLGCSYGIRFRSEKMLDVIRLLKQAEIPYSLVND